MQAVSNRSFVSVADVSKGEFASLLERTKALKESILKREAGNLLSKKVVGLRYAY